MRKASVTLLLFTGLLAVPHFVPALDGFKVPLPVSLPKKEIAVAAATPETAPSQPTVTPVSDTGKPAQKPRIGGIEDPSGKALNTFFKGLAASRTGKRSVVISHYGDSPITADNITATVRRKLQKDFGDAGHGFILAARPWPWYDHQNVAFQPGKGWKADPMFFSRPETRCGFGGVIFTASGPDIETTVGTSETGGPGASVTAFELYFLAQPGGGSLNLELDGKPAGRVSTAGEAPHSDFHRIEVSPGPHRLTARTVGDGEVKLFGFVLENGKTGVAYDSLGVNGGFIQMLSSFQNEKIWAEQLRRRAPDLVILGYGANESEFDNLPMDRYEVDTREAIRRIRNALPNASILLLGPMDRGKRGPGGSVITRPMIPRLVATQRRIAAETGCAFFDTYSAMGGEGTVSRWLETRPRLMGGDLTHPTVQGSERVGDLIYEALLNAYRQFNPL